MSEKIRIAVIDDHPMLRAGVTHTLMAEPDFAVVGEGGSASDAIRIARDELPDIILLDVNMPGGGIEAVQAIASVCPVVKVVILTVLQNEETVSAALQAGARGYILKGISGPDFVRAVRNIDRGEHYVSPTLATRLLAAANTKNGKKAVNADPLSALTAREEQILSLVAEGLSNKEVGARLKLSEKTVKYYMTNILQKLQVRNRVEAALLAQKRLH
jgi:two-component system, NarL family, nitrate/nitrite response regulator NarL